MYQQQYLHINALESTWNVFKSTYNEPRLIDEQGEAEEEGPLYSGKHQDKYVAWGCGDAETTSIPKDLSSGSTHALGLLCSPTLPPGLNHVFLSCFRGAGNPSHLLQADLSFACPHFRSRLPLTLRLSTTR